nr:hypothetical protein [uncultured Flavobacterium sp.]
MHTRNSYDTLQTAISIRQNELNRVATILANNAEKFSYKWTSSKVAVIALGALAATKGTFDKLLSADNPFNLILFTCIGLLVAIITGLETTFKYESKTLELKILAAECHSTARQIDTLWFQKISHAPSDTDYQTEAMLLLEIQDDKLADIQARATKIGINLTYQIKSTISSDDNDDNKNNNNDSNSDHLYPA